MPSSLKVLIRYLRNHPLVSAINVAGLSLGLTAGILALIFVTDELSYDQFHEKKDRIYRIGSDMFDANSGESNGIIETNPWPVGDRLKKQFPEIEAVVYIRNASNLQLKIDGNNYRERFYFAGEDFFNIFTYPLLKGNAETALLAPWSVVITEEMERKYFKDEDALGQSLTFSDTLVFTVTGVMKNVPRQSHMRFSMLGSFSTYPLINPSFNTDGGWGNFNIRNYLLLKENTDFASFEAKARNICMDEAGEAFRRMGMEVYSSFEVMKDIYLKTTRGNGFGPTGSYERLVLIGTISFFIVIIACINFINLATARSINRAKEVGLRKVIGSNRSQLIRQFMMESFLLTVLSFFIAIGLLDLSLPFFNELLQKQYVLSELLNPTIALQIALLLPTVALLAGYYPALVLSGFKPAEVLKGKLATSSRGINLRKGLIVFQFALSIALVVGTLVVSRQLNYMTGRDLGFDQEQVVVLNTWQLPLPEVQRAAQPLRGEIENLSGVTMVSHIWATPGRSGWRGQWAFPEGFPDGENVSVEYIPVDYNYVKAMDMEIVAGVDFDEEKASDLEQGLILNERAVELMRWGTPEDAIGKTIESPSGHPAGTVIGVVKNYHQHGLQEQIGPIVLDHYTDFSRFFAVKVQNMSEQWLAELEAVWSRHFEEYPLNYFFLDEDFQRQYRDERSYAKVVTTFAIVAIFIAVIGLFGLVSFIVTSRSKEIGVRKVLGAGELTITFLLSREFIILLIVAMVITSPFAWYFADQWLQGFAYHTNVSPSVFIFGFLITFLVTFITIGYQTIKAAKANPVETLRGE